MTAEDLRAEVGRQVRSLRTLALLGAAVQQRSERGHRIDPETDKRVADVVAALSLTETVATVDADALDYLGAEIRTAFFHVLRLLSPGTAPGWTHTDAALLRG